MTMSDHSCEMQDWQKRRRDSDVSKAGERRAIIIVMLTLAGSDCKDGHVHVGGTPGTLEVEVVIGETTHAK